MELKVGAAQYQIDFLEDWESYETKITKWVKIAAREGAQVLLFPEYASLELSSLFPKEVYQNLARQLSEIQKLKTNFIELYKSLALKNNCYIQAGTFPIQLENGDYRNRAYLFWPDGKQVDYQDKLQMTRFENEQWFIKGGTEIKTFQTDFGKMAINVCYDSEFPLFARKQVEEGANIILVPSCTDTLAGYYRVRIGCQARALENQCYVLQSPTVGKALWSEAIDENIGAAAIYTPVDRGFPDNGILSMGELNQRQWVFAEISLSKIQKVRDEGQVFNYKDWNSQKNFF